MLRSCEIFLKRSAHGGVPPGEWRTASWRVIGLAAETWLSEVFRRALGAWIVLAIVASTIAFYRFGPDQSGPSDSGRSAIRPAGPGTTEPGILLVVTRATDAAFAVTELVLLDAPTTSVTVRPPDFSAAGSTFDAAKPYASKVRITARNQSVPVPDGIVNRSQTFSLDEPAKRYAIRYELNRAIVRSGPSSAGRALGAIRPLTTDQPVHMTVAVVTVGSDVRNLSCPGLALSIQACATGKSPLLRVRQALPWRTATVIMQLDLPDPS